MPAFHSLGSNGVNAVVKYLRVLQGRGQASVLPGNAARGQALFFGKANCSSCHMIAGRGGFIASDLSNYGKSHSVDETREAILKPGRDSELHAKHALVKTNDGKQYEGMIRNEDNFSVQLQALDGTYHFFDRMDIKGIDYSAGTLMPTDYSTTLNRSELNDLITYLITTAKNSKSQAASNDED